MSEAEPEFPELAKMREVREESQAIGEFLEWASSRGYLLAHYVQYDDCIREVMTEVTTSTEELLAEHFEIDLEKVEAERREILRALQDVED